MNSTIDKTKREAVPQDPTSLTLHIPIEPQRLKYARHALGLSVEEAASRCSLNKMTLLRYESGDIQSVSPERLLRLAALYAVTPAYLAGIFSQEEFYNDTYKLLLSPKSASAPTFLGRRLLACLHFHPGAKNSERESGHSAG